jgi:hypothetical protein
MSREHPQSTVPVAAGRFSKLLRYKFCIPALEQIFSDFLCRLRFEPPPAPSDWDSH